MADSTCTIGNMSSPIMGRARLLTHKGQMGLHNIPKVASRSIAQCLGSDRSWDHYICSHAGLLTAFLGQEQTLDPGFTSAMGPGGLMGNPLEITYPPLPQIDLRPRNTGALWCLIHHYRARGECAQLSSYC